jgi:hypothetical protein
MRKAGPAPASPDAYVASLSGWKRDRVAAIRKAVQTAQAEEVIKWGHLVYLSGGPAFLIRAEENRLLLGFWRGQRLRELEPRLKPGGRYEMATLHIQADTELDLSIVERLAIKAVELNRSLGDPTKP